MPVPLAARMRPRNLNEIVGQQHLLTPGSVLHKMANQTQEDRSPEPGPDECCFFEVIDVEGETNPIDLSVAVEDLP